MLATITFGDLLLIFGTGALVGAGSVATLWFRVRKNQKP